MQVPMFYSYNKMTVIDWFSNLLANEKPEQDDLRRDEEQEDVVTHIYKVTAKDSFQLNGQTHSPGLYYMRATVEEAEQLSKICQVHKFCFSELVYYSDLFSTIAANLIPEEDEIKEMIENGKASRYFEEGIGAINCEGLEVMRKKVWTRHFDQGIMGVVRRFFSALANFFTKYTKFIDTGIYWPGNSCNYADKVVNQLNRIKRVFVCMAYKASQEILSDRLDIPLDEIEKMTFDEIKVSYRQKAKQLHPDKNQALDAADQFRRVNQVWGDFTQLFKLKDEFEESDNEEIFSPKEEKKFNQIPMFKSFLALPEPVIVN